MTVHMEDGTTLEIKAGDVFDIPPGHHAEVTGDARASSSTSVGSRSTQSTHSSSATKPSKPPALRSRRTTLAPMRGMFLIWTGVIVAGLVFLTIVGLAHH
jgi:hypothetical protein